MGAKKLKNNIHKACTLEAIADRYRKKETELRLQAIALRMGKERTVYEIDLEKGGKGASYSIGMLDSVLVRAGMSEFEIVFMGMDGGGNLKCLIFENRLLKDEKSYAMSETENVWGGMLMDGRLFRIALIRSPVLKGVEGKIAHVEVKIEMTDRPAITF